MIKPRRIKRAGHVARMGEMTSAYKTWLESLRKGNHSRDPGKDGTLIEKLYLWKCILAV
jgi:hypothetical protein